MDVSDESGGTKQVDSLGDVLRLGDTLDELGNEALDILVDDKAANLLHGAVGVLLDLGFRVPHGLGDDGDEIWNAEGELDRRRLDESLDALETGQLLRPLLRRENRVDDRWECRLDGIWVHGLDNGDGGILGKVLHVDHLVGDGRENRAEEGKNVRLDAGSDGGVLSNGEDGLESPLTSTGILLVGELLLEELDSPETVSSEFCQTKTKKTYLVGTACSSQGPLRRVAMLLAAALVSSTDLETESDWKSSSRTATEEAVSLAETAGTETDSTEGILVETEGLKLDEETRIDGRGIRRRSWC